jgi:VIT1/CCC1 family predicted Fe2+/Mn2+ transporter
VPAVAGASLLCLGALGWLAASVGGARPLLGTVRVVFWGALAMGITAAIGALFGTSVG